MQYTIGRHGKGAMKTALGVHYAAVAGHAGHHHVGRQLRQHVGNTHRSEGLSGGPAMSKGAISKGPGHASVQNIQGSPEHLLRLQFQQLLEGMVDIKGGHFQRDL
jgi:hypothetical protein